MSISRFLLLASAFTAVIKAQGISACPTTEDLVTVADGSKYAVCQQTDYQGPTLKSVDTVATQLDCIKACNADGTCQRAVYEKINYRCHLKGDANTVTWAKDERFTTFRLISKPTTGSTITACPYGESNQTSSTGQVFAVCPNTDYQGDTAFTTGGVTSVQDCANACAQNGQCTQAVYQQSSGDCHLKGTGLQWIYNPNFQSMRSVLKLNNGDPIKSCPSKPDNITTDNGAVFASCPFSDFQIASQNIIGGSNNAGACANSCASATNCAQAVWDNANNVCHLKGNQTTLNWSFNTQYTTLQMVNSTTPPSSNLKGQWSAPIQFPIIPVAAYVVPQDPSPERILVFSSYGARAFSGPTGITQFADYNFNTGAVSQRQISNTKHDMFCPGISSIAGGKIVISGGENAEAVSIFDPQTNAFTRAADMNIPRGYQTSATLSNGNIFTIGGSFTGPLGGKTGEVYDPKTNQWTLLKGADPTPLLTVDKEGVWRTDNHAWLYGWSNGWVFQGGPSRAMNWYNTNNGGSVQPGGRRNSDIDQMCGANVMYDVGKILSAGGSQDYTDSPATKAAHIITITDPGVPATVERISDMNWARGFANAVVLPDGKVVISGGQLRSLVFTDIDSVFQPEIFDPATKTFTQMAPAKIPRNYHSVGILLPDGTVFVGGGGMCPAAQGDDLSWCDRAKDHFDGEIFSPPYLFDASGKRAARPNIQTLSTTKTTAGSTITVTLQNMTDAKFSMVRMGSATHSINSDQRRVPLTNIKSTGSTYQITLPKDNGILLPGAWYLFALSKAGVPSVARTINVTV